MPGPAPSDHTRGRHAIANRVPDHERPWPPREARAREGARRMTGTPGAPVRVRAIAPADLPRVWELLRGLAEYERMTDVLTGSEALLSDALFGNGPRAEGRVAEHDGRLVG